VPGDHADHPISHDTLISLDLKDFRNKNSEPYQTASCFHHHSWDKYKTPLPISLIPGQILLYQIFRSDFPDAPLLHRSCICPARKRWLPVTPVQEISELISSF